MANYTITTTAKQEAVLVDAGFVGQQAQQAAMQDIINTWIRTLADQQSQQLDQELKTIRQLATPQAKQQAKQVLVDSIAPPVVTPIANRIEPLNTVVSFQVVATDPDLTPLEYFAQNLPPGISIGRDSGLVSGTLTATTGSPHSTVVKVRKANEIVVNAPFTWTVTP